MPEDLKIDRRTLLKTAVSAGAAAAAPAVLAADANAVRWSEVHDVVIAGAGGAGLAAAVMASSISKDVVVLEKTQDVGGNTRLADAFNAVDPAVQKPLGIEDSPELHARQMLETGRWCADPKLVETVATGAPRALAWLKELGVRFEPGVYQVYGSLWPRTHSPSEPEGSGYIRPLLFKCRELGVSIRTGTKVLRVIRNGLEGPVLGVEAERMNGRRLFIRARRGVVVATGGFGANAELVGRFAPRLGHLRSTNLPGTTGDLIAPLEDIGAAAVGMDFFQLLPGSAEDGRFIGAASTVERMIFVNRAGERFIAEDSPSSKLSAAVLAQPGGIAFPILDANGYSAMRTLSRAMFDRALMRGDAFEANSIPELASLLQIPAEALVATVEAYNEAVETGHDPVGRRAVVLMHPSPDAPSTAPRSPCASTARSAALPSPRGPKCSTDTAASSPASTPRARSRAASTAQTTWAATPSPTSSRSDALRVKTLCKSRLREIQSSYRIHATAFSLAPPIVYNPRPAYLRNTVLQGFALCNDAAHVFLVHFRSPPDTAGSKYSTL